MGEIDSCHFMDVTSAPGFAFAEAFNRLITTTAWLPDIRAFAGWPPQKGTKSRHNNVFAAQPFQLQRGYQYAAVSRLFDCTGQLKRQLLATCQEPSQSLLICTSPYWAELAEQWPGPCVYYSLDLTVAYAGVIPSQILRLDTRLCRKASLVAAVSSRIKDYFVEKAGCNADKIIVLPNATRSENIQSAPSPSGKGLRPVELKDVNTPVVGIIGNMAENVDWVLLSQAMAQSNGLRWVFVGPHDARIVDRAQREARRGVMKRSDALFVGEKPYRELQAYARAFDVAVLPYRRREPTFSGSATRFYEHLAAGRPMIATPHVQELERKQPLLRLVNSAAELLAELRRLQELGFKDGSENNRIRASRAETWDVRARTMLDGLWQRNCQVNPLAGVEVSQMQQ